MSVTGKNALLVGGNGRVARLTTPLLHAAGFAVTSLIRNKDRLEEVAELGAAPVIQDVTRADQKTWETLLAGTDVVVWAAGTDPADTFAVDRDAPITLIDALDDSAYPPRLLILGCAGDPPGMERLVKAKQAVAKRLQDSQLNDAAILGPAPLTDTPARGILLIDADCPTPPRQGTHTTSRELVAQVIVELAARPQSLGRIRLNFMDGDGQVAAI